MKRLSVIACACFFTLSFNVQAGFFDSVKKAAGEIAQEVTKDVKYQVDQTMRNAFPAIKVATQAEDTPEGFGDEILVFGFESCPYCAKVEKMLRKHRIPYKEMDVVKSKSAKKAFRKLGGGGVPVTVIGDRTIRGFSEEKIMDILKEQGFI